MWVTIITNADRPFDREESGYFGHNGGYYFFGATRVNTWVVLHKTGRIMPKLWRRHQMEFFFLVL